MRSPFPILGACVILGIVSLGAQEGGGEASAVRGARSAVKDGFLANEFQRVDPTRDGWDTEVFHDAIKPLLKQLLIPLGERESWEDSGADDLCYERFKATDLRPAELARQTLSGGSRCGVREGCCPRKHE